MGQQFQSFVQKDTFSTLFSIPLPAPIAQLVECPLRGTGGHGFDPGP